MKTTMGEKIKNMRVEHHMTTKQLALATGISEAVLNGLENDNGRDVGYSRIIELAKFFEVPTDYPLGFTESRITKNIELKELGLSDKAIEVLLDKRQDNALVSQLIEHDELWECDKGHTWEATPNKMVRRTSLGCPYCANQKIIAGFNDLQSKNPEIANEWHPTKNGALQPNEVAEHSNKSVWWLCPKGHEYKASVNMRTRANRSRGCPYCANRRILSGFNDLETICPDVAAEWHPTKNNNLKPCDVGAGSSREVWWKCPLGHEYKASLNSRVIKGKPKNGCPVCANKVILIGYNDLETLFPYVAKEWDVNKNDGLLPSDIISGSHKKYWWLCPFGHSYQASPENRTKEKGTGCPICAKEQQSSFPEQAHILLFETAIFECRKQIYIFRQRNRYIHS